MKKAPNPKAFGTLAAVVGVLGVGLLYTQYGSLSSAKAEVDQLKADVKDEKQVNKLLADSKTSLTELKTKLAHLELGIPDAAYVPTMLKELENLGTVHGIRITGVRPVVKAPTTGKAADKRAYDDMDIELKGQGKYGDVLRFVKALNSFPKVVATRTVTLSPRSSGTDNAGKVLDVTIQLRAYVFSDGAAKSGATKAETKPGATT